MTFQYSPAVHYVILQNTELAIYQEAIELPKIKIKFFEVLIILTSTGPIWMIFYWARKSLTSVASVA